MRARLALCSDSDRVVTGQAGGWRLKLWRRAEKLSLENRRVEARGAGTGDLNTRDEH